MLSCRRRYAGLGVKEVCDFRLSWRGGSRRTAGSTRSRRSSRCLVGPRLPTGRWTLSLTSRYDSDSSPSSRRRRRRSSASRRARAARTPSEISRRSNERSAWSSADPGLGQSSSTSAGTSRLPRRPRSAATRHVTIISQASNARGSLIEPPCSNSRTHTSWTMSSTSLDGPGVQPRLPLHHGAARCDQPFEGTRFPGADRDQERRQVVDVGTRRRRVPSSWGRASDRRRDADADPLGDCVHGCSFAENDGRRVRRRGHRAEFAASVSGRPAARQQVIWPTTADPGATVPDARWPAGGDRARGADGAAQPRRRAPVSAGRLPRARG